jgi:hypothetical protein
MKATVRAALVLALAVAIPSWAGLPAAPLPTSAPAMNEGGLVMLALALAGTGLTLLGGRRR